MEHISCKERLRELRLLRLEKKLMRIPTMSMNI